MGDPECTELEADLEALIRELKLQPCKLEPITSLTGSALERSVFRLERSDGSLLKARRIDDPNRAERVFAVSTDLDHPAFAKTLGQRGSALVEEWVLGKALKELDEISPSIMRACGAIAGEMHTTPPCEDRWGPIHRPNDRLFSHLRWISKQLFRLECISESLWHEIMTYVTELIPSVVEYGFVHQDLAPENVILEPGGALRIIDNANFDVFPCDLDLARTWYRWPLEGASESAFLEGYREHRSPDGFHDNFAFWALAVFLKAAWFRRRSKVPGIDIPLSMLSRLVEALRSGERQIDPNSLRR